MFRKIKKTVQFILPIAFAVGLLLYAYKGTDIGAMFHDITKAKYSWLLIALLPTVISHLSRAQRWRFLMRPLGYNPTFIQTFTAVMGGYFANLVLPRMGEVTRCGMLQKSAGVPMQASLGTVVAERAFDLLMLLLITLLAFALEFTKLTSFFAQIFALKNGAPHLPKDKSQIMPLIAILILALFVLVYMFRKQILKNQFSKKIIIFAKGLIDGLFSVAKMQDKMAFVLHTLLIWIGYYATAYISFAALPSTAHLDLAAALTILVVGSFGMVAPVQGGIGAYHYMVSKGFTELYQVGQQGANTAALLMHSSQTLFTIILGGFCTLIGFIVVKKINTANDLG